MLAGVVAGALLPAVAWAYTDPTALSVGDELARRRTGKAVGAVGLVGTLCCLAVVAAIVLGVIMLARRRK